MGHSIVIEETQVENNQQSQLCTLNGLMQHVSAEHKAIRQIRQKGKNPLCKSHNPCIWLGSQLHKNIIKHMISQNRQ
jgi:hypothetical protein